MRKAWIWLTVCAVGLAAFFLGVQYRSISPEPGNDATAQVGDQQQVREARRASEQNQQEVTSAEPPRTYRGPDGLPHMINYQVGKPLDDNDPELIRAAVLADMKNHPKNIVRAYGLELSEVRAIASGKKPFPPALTPRPASDKE